MKKFLLAATCLVATCVAAMAYDYKCESSVKDLDAEIAKGDKQISNRIADRTVHFIEGGKCVKLAAKLGLAVFSDKVAVETADLEEAVACMKIERHQKVKSCTCRTMGLKNEADDEPLEGAIDQTYKRMMEASKKYTEKMILNPGIKDWVDRATKIKACVDVNTLRTLQKIESDLATAVELPPPAPIDYSPLPSRPAAAPAPTVTTTVTAPAPTVTSTTVAPAGPTSLGGTTGGVNTGVKNPADPVVRGGSHVIPPDPKSRHSTIKGPIRSDGVNGGNEPSWKISRPKFLGGGTNDKPGGVSIGTQKLEVRPMPELAPIIDEAKKLMEKQR
jgi:hypothetical protein